VTRFADSANQTEAAKQSVKMFVAVALDFSSGFVRAHDGIGTITWGGNDYLRLGQFGGIEAAQESVEVISRAISLTLSGVDSSLISTAMTETYQNRTATVYLGFLNSDTNALIGTPETAWEGRMNQMSISSTAGAATIRLTCEHRLRREPRIARYTNEDQQLLFAGDRFFDLVYSIKGFVAKWGDRDATYSGGGGGFQMPYNGDRFRVNRV